MPNQSALDLLTMFKAASRSLKQNKEALNQADDYNHNHGDNMVSIFRVITKAMETKRMLLLRTNSNMPASYYAKTPPVGRRWLIRKGWSGQQKNFRASR